MAIQAMCDVCGEHLEYSDDTHHEGLHVHIYDDGEQQECHDFCSYACLGMWVGGIA